MKMRFRFRIVLFLAAASSAFGSTLTILTFNDVYEIVADESGRGGFAELYTLLRREREKANHHLTTVNGDFLSPCILSTFDEGAHRIELFNRIGVDVVVAGNHEFDFGPDVVLKRIEESNFPWLTANAVGVDGRPFTGDRQTMTVDVDGIKVGFFGLITVDTPSLSDTRKKVGFTPLVYTAREMVERLKSQGAEVIVALTHLHTREDKLLAEEVPEISVILGGHDHNPETYYNEKTLIHKSGQNANYLARVDLDLERDEETGRVRVFPSWSLILNKDVPRDPDVGAVVDRLQENLQLRIGEPLGVMGMYCDTLYANLRSRESEFGNFVTDSLRRFCGTDIGFFTGGLIRGNTTYRPGDVLSLRDLITELPFKNIVVAAEMRGEVILEALENGVSKIGYKAGRFPQVSGIRFTYDANFPVGSRIREVFVGEERLDPLKDYTVATVDYLFNGGDGYEMFKKGKVLLSPLRMISLVDVMVDYLKNGTPIVAELEGRIRIIDAKTSLDDRKDLH